MALHQGTVNELALFAGAGGGILGGLLCGFRTVCAVEKSPYRREVLMRRQRDGLLPLFPIWDNVTTFDGRPWRGIVDVLTAGFPCQPWSLGTGEQPGDTDDRNLWPDTARIIREVGPRSVLLENVPTLLVHEYAGSVFGSLAEGGFDIAWDCIPASACGSDQRRDRVWILAHAVPEGLEGDERSELAYRQQIARHIARRRSGFSRNPRERIGCDRSDFCRRANAPANVVDRLAAVGEMQVPIVVKKAWEFLNL